MHVGSKGLTTFESSRMRQTFDSTMFKRVASIATKKDKIFRLLKELHSGTHALTSDVNFFCILGLVVTHAFTRAASLAHTYCITHMAPRHSMATLVATITSDARHIYQIKCVVQSNQMYSPCFLIAKFLGNDLSQLLTESVRDFLGEVLMGAPAENLDVRHFPGVVFINGV